MQSESIYLCTIEHKLGKDGLETCISISKFSSPASSEIKTLPKASHEFYPAIVLPIGSEIGHLYFFCPDKRSLQRTKSDNWPKTQTYFKHFSPSTPHPGTHQMVFRGKPWGAGNAQPA